MRGRGREETRSFERKLDSRSEVAGSAGTTAVVA